MEPQLRLCLESLIGKEKVSSHMPSLVSFFNQFGITDLAHIEIFFELKPECVLAMMYEAKTEKKITPRSTHPGYPVLPTERNEQTTTKKLPCFAPFGPSLIPSLPTVSMGVPPATVNNTTNLIPVRPNSLYYLQDLHGLAWQHANRRMPQQRVETPSYPPVPAVQVNRTYQPIQLIPNSRQSTSQASAHAEIQRIRQTDKMRRKILNDRMVVQKPMNTTQPFCNWNFKKNAPKPMNSTYGQEGQGGRMQMPRPRPMGVIGVPESNLVNPVPTMRPMKSVGKGTSVGESGIRRPSFPPFREDYTPSPSVVFPNFNSLTLKNSFFIHKGQISGTGPKKKQLTIAEEMPKMNATPTTEATFNPFRLDPQPPTSSSEVRVRQTIDLPSLSSTVPPNKVTRQPPKIHKWLKYGELKSGDFENINKRYLEPNRGASGLPLKQVTKEKKKKREEIVKMKPKHSTKKRKRGKKKKKKRKKKKKKKDGENEELEYEILQDGDEIMDIDNEIIGSPIKRRKIVDETWKP